MTAAELRTSVAAAIAATQVVIATASAGEYTSVIELEAAVGAVRATIDALLPSISTVWGVKANPLLVHLQALAARLLDLRELVNDAGQVIEDITDRETSLIEIATASYGDWTRWTEVADLNRRLPAPARIPAGTTVVRHAR